jgi:hypothetical protein
MQHLRSDYDDFAVLDAKIPDDEPVFLLRAQDPSSEIAVRAWCDDAERLGADPDLVRATRDWATRMGEYARAKGKRVADVPAGALKTGQADV